MLTKKSPNPLPGFPALNGKDWGRLVQRGKESFSTGYPILENEGRFRLPVELACWKLPMWLVSWFLVVTPLVLLESLHSGSHSEKAKFNYYWIFRMKTEKCKTVGWNIKHLHNYPFSADYYILQSILPIKNEICCSHQRKSQVNKSSREVREKIACPHFPYKFHSLQAFLQGNQGCSLLDSKKTVTFCQLFWFVLWDSKG